MDIETLTQRDINKFILSMQERELKSATIASYVRILKTFVSYCRAQGLTDLIVKPYKVEETVKDTYTDIELKKLLKKPNMRSCSFTEYRTWVIINLLLNSGCRAATVRNI